MKPISLAILAVAATLTATSVPAEEPGSQYCFGTGCPCGNDDPTGGCVNSTGQGALLTVGGSASVSADDAIFVGTRIPKHSVTLLLIGDTANDVPFKDGELCVGGKVERLDAHKNSGKDGRGRFDHVIQGFLDQNRVIEAGDTFYFQLWFRDAPAKNTPCGGKSNTSNGYMITFEP